MGFVLETSICREFLISFRWSHKLVAKIVSSALLRCFRAISVQTPPSLKILHGRTRQVQLSQQSWVKFWHLHIHNISIHPYILNKMSIFAKVKIWACIVYTFPLYTHTYRTEQNTPHHTTPYHTIITQITHITYTTYHTYHTYCYITLQYTF